MGLCILEDILYLVADDDDLVDGVSGERGSDFAPDGVEEHRRVDEHKSTWGKGTCGA